MPSIPDSFILLARPGDTVQTLRNRAVRRLMRDRARFWPSESGYTVTFDGETVHGVVVVHRSGDGHACAVEFLKSAMGRCGLDGQPLDFNMEGQADGD